MRGRAPAVRRARAAALLAGALAAGSLAGGSAAPATAAEVLHVFAAASLSEAFQDIASAFHAANPGVRVEFNFAGSQILRVQIEEGAHADLFAAADRVQMDSLVHHGLASRDSVFAQNRLVVVIPREGAKVRSLADLARPGLRIVMAEETVPAGRYTARVLENLDRSGTCGDEYARRVRSNLVSQETSVRAVLTRVAMDEADAGFVYATDARTAAGKVAVIAIPDSVNVIAAYPIAVIAKSARRDEAARFIAFVRGERGRAILRERGFQTPP